VDPKLRDDIEEEKKLKKIKEELVHKRNAKT